MIKGDKILDGKWILSGGKIYDPFKEKYIKGNILISDGKFVLTQSPDIKKLKFNNFQVVSKAKPSKKIFEDLILAFHMHFFHYLCRLIL